MRCFLPMQVNNTTGKHMTSEPHHGTIFKFFSYINFLFIFIVKHKELQTFASKRWKQEEVTQAVCFRLVSISVFLLQNNALLNEGKLWNNHASKNLTMSQPWLPSCQNISQQISPANKAKQANKHWIHHVSKVCFLRQPWASPPPFGTVEVLHCARSHCYQRAVKLRSTEKPKGWSDSYLLSFAKLRPNHPAQCCSPKDPPAHAGLSSIPSDVPQNCPKTACAV